MRSSRDFMLLSPPERAEAAEPLGDEGSLGPDPERPFVPPALYLPSTGVPNARGTEIELRRLRDGRMALLAYTAVDRLVKCMGPNQPWALFLTENLNDLAEKQGTLASRRKEIIMANEVKIDYDDAEDIKNNFYTARDDLESDKKGFPESVDGGDGTEYIVDMITKIAEDAGDIAICSGLGGDKMANAANKINGVDESVAQTFRQMEKEIS